MNIVLGIISFIAGIVGVVLICMIVRNRSLKEKEGRNKVKTNFYYITPYSLDLCLEYMKHENISDIFSYNWEKEEDYYLITFKEYKNRILSLANAPKPTFKVVFIDLGNSTGINVEFLSSFFQSVPFVSTKDINTFWEKKLDAKKKSILMTTGET